MNRQPKTTKTRHLSLVGAVDLENASLVVETEVNTREANKVEEGFPKPVDRIKQLCFYGDRKTAPYFPLTFGVSLCYAPACSLV